MAAERPPVGCFPPDPPPLHAWIRDLEMKAVGRLAVWLSRWFGSRAGADLGILTYHRCAPEIAGAAPPLYNVTPERFREHVVGLLARGFAFWPLSRVLRQRAARLPVPPRTIVMTFDDGFQSVYTHAWPVLRELDVRATLFVSTGYLDSPAPFPFDPWGNEYQGRVPPETYRPLTTAQCREMAEDGRIELGAHTHWHADYRLEPARFEEDLRLCAETMWTRFGVREPMFAFPFGSSHRGFTNDGLIGAARRAGMVCGLSTESALVDPRSDPYGWGRFNAFCWDTSATLAAKLEGWYGWAAKLEHAVRRRSLARPEGARKNSKSVG
jgi:peptidoglycan/xylan/chitin deacetylase (PgdA/CDA1 family)